ncbi:universal stress protein [Desulfosudis oleivorans]|uniref:UspA domain protein n=1 Tax=Desulfosudis oleivorans (strain DSM 6200 / JCM 39069 / Hxd3) TaxID=96561 RepID=A8ZYN0_DESOH|nr:universal stress protein [Desulfosudis oleivorans]ABW67135.1 UspA domain protein [Desulfosudis oleivorans Hxd3]
MNTQAQQKILVLFDGSQRSRQTVEQLAWMESFKTREIVLFQVFADFPENYWDLTWEKNNARAVEQFAEWRKRMADENHMYLETARKVLLNAGFDARRVSVKLQKQEKDVATDILAEARNGYHAVIMRRRGMNTIQNVVLGSVSSKLLANLSDQPVLLMGKRSLSKKMVIGIDGSPSSMQAVKFVADLYGGHGYMVELLHVIRSHNLDFMPTEMIEAHKQRMDRTFSEMREVLVAAGFEAENVEGKIITGAESRSEAIVVEAESDDTGAIVVGRRGLSRVQAFFMGRVSNKVVHRGKEFSVWVI